MTNADKVFLKYVALWFAGVIAWIVVAVLLRPEPLWPWAILGLLSGVLISRCYLKIDAAISTEVRDHVASCLAKQVIDEAGRGRGDKS